MLIMVGSLLHSENILTITVYIINMSRMIINSDEFKKQT